MKNKPVVLHCHATVELEQTALKNLQCGDLDQAFDLDFDDSNKAPEDDFEEESKLDDPAREKRIKDGYLLQKERTYFTALRPDGADTIQHLSGAFGQGGPSNVENLDDEEDDNEGEDLMFGGRGRHRRNTNRPQVIPEILFY